MTARKECCSLLHGTLPGELGEARQRKIDFKKIDFRVLRPCDHLHAH
jgi:hypothetical protein